jgi:sigma-B regulation protein RsbU (phosphoserine phosphatase)
MPVARRVADFLHDLQQLERSPRGEAILDAFTRHMPSSSGLLYLRDAREGALRLAAMSGRTSAPDVLEGELPDEIMAAADRILIPLRSHREALGLIDLALDRSTAEAQDEDDIDLLRGAAAYLSSLMTNQRLAQEMREGDFQLKYRLWELESLYDIGLSIAGTLNVDELADEVLFRMISLTNARRAALFLREGADFKVYRSFGDVRSDFLNADITNQLVQSGDAITWDSGADCIFPDCTAFVAVPVRGATTIIGVLAAADRETRDGSVGAFEANELRLLSQFANQVGIALENARLHREALAKQAMERELELAATIQRDILPKSIPVVEGIDLAALSRPARQVGGDYHTFVERDGQLIAVLADVAGKSMPAALLVSALHAAIQLLIAEGRDLGDIATELNKHIHRWSAENKFVTMIMVAIDRESGTIEYVNAGHNPCYIIHEGELDLLRSHGLPVGILGQSMYRTQTRPFHPGSTVVLYSDGITEAENEAGEEYENPRLEEILRASGSLSAAELRDRIATAVDAFVGEAPQKDDQTLVIARLAEG